MARSSRRRGRRRGEPSGLVIGAVGVLVVCLVMGFAWLYLTARANNPERDELFCPKSGPRSQALVLVDASDSIADLTRMEITKRLVDEAASVPTGGRLTIRTLRADASGAGQIFDLCNPGDGAELNEITGNPERARARWREGFEEPLSAALKEATRDAQADRSPIMAAIQQFAVDRLVSRAERSIPTTLIVISDMLENTPDFSMYRGGADYGRYAHSPAAERYQTNLQGAQVELWLIERDKGPADADAIVSFWDQWVTAARGSVSHVLRLQGVSNG